MAAKQITRNIALTPRFDKLLRKQVASGRYQSASEVVRDGLRLLEERDSARHSQLEQLKRDIEIGWQQSENEPMVNGPKVFDEIRQLGKSMRSLTKARR